MRVLRAIHAMENLARMGSKQSFIHFESGRVFRG